MIRPKRATLMLLCAGALGAFAAGCSSEGVDVSSNQAGAELFAARCSGCHSLSSAGAQGSNGERPTGPNLDYRVETRDQVLYAIRNGGFSGAIMPQNIVVGAEAEAVADYVARYAGTKASGPPSPNTGEEPGGDTP